jgi:hypothetical protein
VEAVPEQPPTRVKKALGNAWEESALALIEGVPLAVAGGAIAGLHIARETLLEGRSGLWIEVLDWALLIAEVLLVISLLVPKLIDLWAELTIRLTVARHRVRVARETGKAPEAPESASHSPDD